MATSRLASAFRKTRLAGIGRAGDHDAHAVPQALASALQRLVNLFQQFVNNPARLQRRADPDIALVGEVEFGLDQRLGAEQAPPPRLVAGAGHPLRLKQGLLALAARLGIDEIGEALDLTEIELAVLERAPGELARLGKPRAGKREHRLDQLANHGAAPVHVKLGHVLAGEACRALEPQYEAAIEQRPVRRADIAQGRAPRLGKTAGERFEHLARLRSRDTHDGDGSGPKTARQRDDGVRGYHGRSLLPPPLRGRDGEGGAKAMRSAGWTPLPTGEEPVGLPLKGGGDSLPLSALIWLINSRVIALF